MTTLLFCCFVLAFVALLLAIIFRAPVTIEWDDPCPHCARCKEQTDGGKKSPQGR